eukprot:7308810-Heterocapsa_arctica.AAC.1
MPQPPQALEHNHCTVFFQLSNITTASSDAMLGLALCERYAVRALPGCLRRSAMRGVRPPHRA